MIRVAIVDDKLVNRKTVQGNLLDATNISICLQAVNGEDFLHKMAGIPAHEHPHVVLMDIDMPVMHGIDTIAVGTMKYPQVKFLVLTVFDDDEKLFEAIQAGASGYLLKDDDSTEIVQAITNAVEFNGVPMSPAIARKTLAWMKAADKPATHEDHSETNTLLSARESEILMLMVDGLDYKKIADRLYISPLTVRTHTSKIYEKLHVNSKAQAIQMAHKYKWV